VRTQTHMGRLINWIMKSVHTTSGPDYTVAIETMKTIPLIADTSASRSYSLRDSFHPPWYSVDEREIVRIDHISVTNCDI